MKSPAHRVRFPLFLILSIILFTALECLAAPATRPARTTARATRPSRSFTTQPTDAEIESLIAKLSSDDRLERQRAQDRLVDLGVAAEPRLRRLLKESHDEESISRAQAILRLIGEDRIAGPTFITAHFTEADP